MMPFHTYLFHFGLLGFILSVLFVLFIIAMIGYFIEALLGTDEPDTSSHDYSIHILKQRYAKGKITREEYHQKLHELQAV